MKFVIVLGSNRSTFLKVLGSDIITFLIILGSERIAFLNVLGSDTTIYLIIVGSDRMQAERHISSSKLDYDLPTGLMVITSPASCITPATAMSLHLKLAGFQINNKLGVGGGEGA